MPQRGHHTEEIVGAADALTPRGKVTVRAAAEDGSVKAFDAHVRIDTPEELVSFRNGGILPSVLRQLLKKK